MNPAGSAGGEGGGLRAWVVAHVRSIRVSRVYFWTYATLLFIGTHWPGLDVRVPGVERPDLITHFVVFGVWTVLLWLTGYPGPRRRWASVATTGAVAALYAAVDEGLQALPWIRRNCAWDDYAANCGGILIGCLLVSVVITAARRGRG